MCPPLTFRVDGIETGVVTLVELLPDANPPFSPLVMDSPSLRLDAKGAVRCTQRGRLAGNADRRGPSRTASLKVSLCAFRPKRVPTLVLAHDRLFPPLAAAEV